MRDQNSYVRWDAAGALDSAFSHVTDKEQASKDILALTKDSDCNVRRRITSFLGSAFPHFTNKEQASKNLLTLMKDQDHYVRRNAVGALSSAFPYVTNKEQAWKDMLTLMKDRDSLVRWGAVDALGSAFSHITDKEQAWKDMLTLTKDQNRDVRWGSVGALGSVFPHVTDKKKAWKDLLSLMKNQDRYVRGRAAGALSSAFSHVIDKEQASKDLLALSKNQDNLVRRRATGALGSVFPHIIDKEQAWKDLLALTKDQDRYVRRRAAGALGSVFPHVTYKEQASKDLLALTKDQDRYVRRRVADALGSAFPHVTDMEQAWKDLLALTKDQESYVRWGATSALGSAFLHLTDKEQAWKDLLALTKDKDHYVRRSAVGVLGSNLPYVSNKEQAWKDLLALTKDQNCEVRWRAADVLGSALPYVNDKELASKDLIALTKENDRDVQWGIAGALGTAFPYITDKDKALKVLLALMKDQDRDVRRRAVDALGIAFPHVTDKEQASRDLLALMKDQDNLVRWGAIDALGTAFPHVTAKEQVWMDLLNLTMDQDNDIRVFTYYSLGKISIFKAIDAESEEEYSKELRNAIDFFEKSSNQSIFFNPALFCHPFYKSIYSITFEERDAEAVVKNYIEEAKNAVGESESKKALLEAVNNLENALKEAYKAREKGLESMKLDLKAYKSYCDRATCLLETTNKTAPGATELIRRGLPVIDERIKGILAEIQENSQALCRQTKGTELEDYGKKVNRIGQTISSIRDPIGVEKQIYILEKQLAIICKNIHNEERGNACEFLNIAKAEPDIEDKLSCINIVLSKISLQLSKTKEEEITQNGTTINIHNSNIQDSTIQTGSDNLNLFSKLGKKADVYPEKLNKFEEEVFEKNNFPFFSELESEIFDIYKSVYQKERKANISEGNSKTLEFLKNKIHDLNALNQEICWLDVGCGDGRCLEVLQKIQNQDIKKIKYHGIDGSYKCLDDAEKRALVFNLKPKFDKMNAAHMKFKSEYDIVSAILFLHEVDPICLPYVLRNMLYALKDDGTLVISDFQGPYEQEQNVVVWRVEDIILLLENIGGAKISSEFVPSEKYPNELGFYRCYVKKPEFNENVFNNFMQEYAHFLETKKEESKKVIDELRRLIKERVSKILNRNDIDTKNISKEEMKRVRAEIEEEYGIKAHKIRLLTSQIIFLDDKITEYKNGMECAETS